MKAYIVSNKDVRDILQSSTESDETQMMFTEVLRQLQCSFVEYMYNVLSGYMMHYVSLGETDMTFDKHNRIMDRFEKVAEYLNQCDFDVRMINHFESLMNSGAVESYGNFNTNIYDDVHQTVKDYHMEVYGTRHIDRMNDQIIEESNSVAELIMFLAKQIESRFLRYTDEDITSKVLFGIKDNKLMIFVD